METEKQNNNNEEGRKEEICRRRRIRKEEELNGLVIFSNLSFLIMSPSPIFLSFCKYSISFFIPKMETENETTGEGERRRPI
jgi:hypothetical protein